MRSLLRGKNLKLNALEATDLAQIAPWFEDTQFLRFYDMIPAFPHSKRDLAELLEYYQASKDKVIFAIRKLANDKLIGVLGFDDILWASGVATSFIGIGDNESTGRGLGQEAMGLLLDFGFNELNFHRIQLKVISYNERALNLYERVGFKREGVLRDHLLRDGKRHDIYLYGMLRDEYLATRKS